MADRPVDDTVAFRVNQVSAHITAVICKMPHFLDASIGVGRTALSSIGYVEARPEDNAYRLEFLYPIAAGRRGWLVEGRKIWGEEKFKVFFCYDGPMVVIARKQTTCFFETKQVQDLCRYLNALVGIREPVSVIDS